MFSTNLHRARPLLRQRPQPQITEPATREPGSRLLPSKFLERCIFPEGRVVNQNIYLAFRQALDERKKLTARVLKLIELNSGREEATHEDASQKCEAKGYRAGKLVGLINGFAADDGAQHADLGILRGRDFGEVVRKHNEVGVFAHF